MTKVSFHQKVILINAEGKILALKASYKNLRWDLPGGAVEIPEEHEIALRREVQEEAGIEIKNIIPLQVSSGHNKETDEYVLFIGFQAEALSTTITLSSEHTEYKWVTKEEFLQLDATPYLIEFVKDYYNSQNLQK